MAKLNLDIAAEIDIDLLALHSYDVVVDFVQDDADETPVAIEGALTLKGTNTVTGAVVTIEEGDGLSKTANRITITHVAASHAFAKGVWNYNVRGDLDTGYSIPYMKGKITST